MIVGGYSLELYCDNEEKHPNGWLDPSDNNNHSRFPLIYTADGKNCYSLTRKYARQAGWKLKLDGTCLCPLCNKTIKTKKKAITTNKSADSFFTSWDKVIKSL